MKRIAHLLIITAWLLASTVAVSSQAATIEAVQPMPEMMPISCQTDDAPCEQDVHQCCQLAAITPAVYGTSIIKQSVGAPQLRVEAAPSLLALPYKPPRA